MRLNENGCPHKGDCDDIVITSLDSDSDFDLTSPVLISPNPSSGLFHIDTKLEITAMRVLSITGELLVDYHEVRSGIDLSALANGMYILELMHDKGVKSSHILIKNA